MKALQDLTLRSILHRSIEQFPQLISLAEVDGPAMTYKDLGERVQEVSHLLHEQGIAIGDRVAILSENTAHWGVAYFAVTTMGAVAVPVLPDFNAIEVHHIIRHSGCKAIFVSQRLCEKIAGEGFPQLNAVILLNDFSLISLEMNKDRLKEILAGGSKELAKLKNAALRFAGLIPAQVREQDLASIIYTSGTTGNSKGVMLSHRNIVSNAIATSQIVSLTWEDRMLSILPLSHAYECTLGLVTPLMLGGSVYYLDKPPTARILLPAMEKVKPTVMLSVPLVIEKIFKTRILPKFTSRTIMRGIYKIPWFRKGLHKAAGKKLVASFGGELRLFCIGGAALAPEVEKFLREARFPYAIGYGLTETAPLLTGTDVDATRFKSAGKALSGVEIKIVGSKEDSSEGEIVVRGPSVMQGYYNDKVRTAEVLDKDGWFRTGDLGMIDREGYLYIRGRLKNMLLGPSGENIYPEEIETLINESDFVSESLVFQQQDQLVARVYPDYEKLDQDFSAQKLSEGQVRARVAELLEQLRRQVNSRVAGFARINKIIEQTEPFQKTPTQKIKRYLYV